MFIVNNGIKPISVEKNNSFLIKIDTTKIGIPSQVYGTYLGGDDGEDFGYGVTIDKNNITYVTGATTSTVGVPITINTAIYPNIQGYSCAYLIKVNTTLSGQQGLLYGTYLGGNVNTRGESVAIDNNSVAYITGWTDSRIFPIKDGFQTQYQGGTGDSYLLEIDTTKSGMAGLLYGSYIGGDGLDIGHSIAIDSNLNVYIAGQTDSSNFPVKNSYQSTLLNSQDGFLTKLGTVNVSLEISKETCKCIACVGEKIPYTIRITNNGTDSGRNIVVSDILPQGVYVNSMKASYGDLINNNNNIIWNIPYLAPGSSVVANIVVTPTESICYQQEKNIINVSEISSINGTTITNLKDSAITHIECYCNCKKC